MRTLRRSTCADWRASTRRPISSPCAPDLVLQAIVEAFSEARPVSSSFYGTLPLQSSAPITKNVVYFAETRDDALFGKETFERAGDKTDVYLHSHGEAVRSSVYCGLGQRLSYQAEFSISVRAVGENSLVSVETLVRGC